MPEDKDSGISPELIDAQLRFLRRGGPEPDLTDLNEEAKSAASNALNLLEVLVNTGPTPPPLAYDAVAIRLGLVRAPSGEPDAANADHSDPVTAAMADVQLRYSVALSPAPTDGTDFERRFECRSMVESMLIVVVPDETSPAVLSMHARSAFAMNANLSAVAYTNAVASQAVVVTYGDSHRMLEPESGWTVVRSRMAREKLAIALGRYLERSDPQWEMVEPLEGSDVLARIDSDASEVVQEVLDALAATNPRLDHKKEARAFVLNSENDLFVDWAQRVQRGSVSAKGLLAEIMGEIEATS